MRERSGEWTEDSRPAPQDPVDTIPDATTQANLQRVARTHDARTSTASIPGAMTVADHVYKSLELTGSSTSSSDEAIRTAIERASKSIRDIRWFEVVHVRGHVDSGKIAHWQVTLKVGFTLEE